MRMCKTLRVRLPSRGRGSKHTRTKISAIAAPEMGTADATAELVRFLPFSLGKSSYRRFESTADTTPQTVNTQDLRLHARAHQLTYMYSPVSPEAHPKQLRNT